MRGRTFVDFGPGVERRPDGHRRRCIQALARWLDTEKLLATRTPWADYQDLEIFLMGLDAGAQWGSSRKSEK